MCKPVDEPTERRPRAAGLIAGGDAGAAEGSAAASDGAIVATAPEASADGDAAAPASSEPETTLTLADTEGWVESVEVFTGKTVFNNMRTGEVGSAAHARVRAAHGVGVLVR